MLRLAYCQPSRDTTGSAFVTATARLTNTTAAIRQCPAAVSVSHTDRDVLDHDRIAIPQVRNTLHAQDVLMPSRDAR